MVAHLIQSLIGYAFLAYLLRRAWPHVREDWSRLRLRLSGRRSLPVRGSGRTAPAPEHRAPTPGVIDQVDELEYAQTTDPARLDQVAELDFEDDDHEQEDDHQHAHAYESPCLDPSPIWVVALGSRRIWPSEGARSWHECECFVLDWDSALPEGAGIALAVTLDERAAAS